MEGPPLQLAPVWDSGGGKHTATRNTHLTRCYHFVEKREQSRMASRVVDINDCGGTVTWTQGIVPKVVRSIEVMGELVSRRNHCA